MASIRTTQRAPRSCTECSRRKIRCNQKIPCQQCTARKVAHKCARPVVRVHGEVTIAVDIESTQDEMSMLDLLRENSLLRERVTRLEASIALSGDTPARRPRIDDRRLPPPKLLREQEHQFDSHIVTVEIINFTGVRQTEGSQMIAHQGPDTQPTGLRPSDSSPLQTIPSRSLSEAVIHFSLRALGFIHCAVRANIFYSEHQELWSKLSQGDISGTRNHHWMAVYYALLTTGLYFIDIEDLSTNHHLEIQQRCNGLGSGNNLKENKTGLARIWYDACLRELEMANFTGKASLRAIQAIAILTLCNLNFGEMERESLLHGLAVNAARYLGMHRLGSEGKHPRELASKPLWSCQADRELGRRLWWTLVICDWLGCWSRSPSIYPESFDCHLVRGAFDCEILLDASSSSSTTSPLDYHLIMAKLAYLVFTRFKAKREDRLSDSLPKALDELDAIKQSSSLLNTDAPSSFDGALHWTIFPRYLLTQVMEYLRMSLAQLFLFRALETSQDEVDARTEAVRSAESILRARFNRAPGFFQSSWVISAATAASGILLMIDHFCFQNERDEIQTARHLGYISQCLAIIDGLKSNPEVHRRLVALGHLFRSAQDCTLRLPPHKPDIVKYVISHILSPPGEGTPTGYKPTNSSGDVASCVGGEDSNIFSLPPSDSGIDSIPVHPVHPLPTSDPLGWPDDSQGWLDELLPGALEFDAPFLDGFS
ncbi:hypothetical protein FE257_013069 [Aspergillus nanangensis]|uniref:Zn(2)-C6 fungal-type domain-containing protein n=1 Tax=Aspergillus nanangensis TaxID=2582783 RepID=A0AAD4CEY9_ASPNN|nr:hypothetical protein FE257_013069 [Aspergillus nanangensis]